MGDREERPRFFGIFQLEPISKFVIDDLNVNVYMGGVDIEFEWC